MLLFRRPRQVRLALLRCVGAAIVVAAILVSTYPLQSPSYAAHGSWTHHHLVSWDSSSANYSAYGNVGSSNKFDVGHVKVVVKAPSQSSPAIAIRQADCGPVTAQCSPFTSGQVNWPQQRSYVDTVACARADSHKLPMNGSQHYYQPCSRWGLETHSHGLQYNS